MSGSEVWRNVVDEDAAVAIEAGGAGEFFVGEDAGGEDEEVAGERLSSGVPSTEDGGDADGFDFFGAGEFDEGGVEEDVDASVGEFVRRGGGGGGVELFAHEAVGALEDGDVAAADAEGVGEFEPEEAAAVDDGVFAGLASARMASASLRERRVKVPRPGMGPS